MYLTACVLYPSPSMKLLLILAVALFAVASADLPISPRYPGYKMGNPNAVRTFRPSFPTGLSRPLLLSQPILLEAFFDLQCPDCQQAWPVVKQVLQHFGSDQIYFVMHVYPLWLHRQAWDASKVQFNMKAYQAAL